MNLRLIELVSVLYHECIFVCQPAIQLFSDAQITLLEYAFNLTWKHIYIPGLFARANLCRR